MGLESYLLFVKFEEPVLHSEFKDLLNRCGATAVKCASDQNFEIRDSRGLTEMQCEIGNNSHIRIFSLRFSILSPHTVIDQAFEFIRNLSKMLKIELYDPQLKMTNIPIDAVAFKRNDKRVRKRQTIIDNEKGLIIEGGEPTTDYIHKNNLEHLYKSN